MVHDEKLVRKATEATLYNPLPLEKLRALSLVSGTLDIEYAMEFYEMGKKATGSYLINSTSLERTQSPVCDAIFMAS